VGNEECQDCCSSVVEVVVGSVENLQRVREVDTGETPNDAIGYGGLREFTICPGA
jgi:hypothetical protein